MKIGQLPYIEIFKYNFSGIVKMRYYRANFNINYFL